MSSNSVSEPNPLAPLDAGLIHAARTTVASLRGHARTITAVLPTLTGSERVDAMLRLTTCELRVAIDSNLGALILAVWLHDAWSNGETPDIEAAVLHLAASPAFRDPTGLSADSPEMTHVAIHRIARDSATAQADQDVLGMFAPTVLSDFAPRIVDPADPRGGPVFRDAPDDPGTPWLTGDFRPLRLLARHIPMAADELSP